MKKTARTAAVADAAGWIMPYLRATSIDMSAISGNRNDTLRCPLNSIRSRIERSQAIWLALVPTDSPSRRQFSASNSRCKAPNITNSEVHTGVKSDGWLKSTTHFPL